MDLTAPLTNVLQFFLKRRGEERERTADYLDAIAEDAKGIAEVWQEILRKYEEGEADPASDSGIDRAINGLGIYRGSQMYRYAKLEGFYQSISQVVGRTRQDELQSTIMYKLGSLLQSRNLAKRHVEIALANARRAVLLDERNTHSEISDIQAAVLAIQREAAALEVLAKTYRASMRTSS